MGKSNEKLYKAYKFRAYPEGDQYVILNKTFGCVRFIYNKLLEDKSNYYKENKKNLKREVTYYKKQEQYSFLKEVDSLALANAKLNLEKSFKNFFEKRSKYPTFHKKGRNDSYTTNMVNGNIKLSDKYITLPKVGKLKIKKHRPIKENEIIKSVTVSKNGNCYYVSVLVEYNNIIELKNKKSIPYDKVIGIDYSSPLFYYVEDIILKQFSTFQSI